MRPLPLFSLPAEPGGVAGRLGAGSERRSGEVRSAWNDTNQKTEDRIDVSVTQGGSGGFAGWLVAKLWKVCPRLFQSRFLQ